MIPYRVTFKLEEKKNKKKLDKITVSDFLGRSAAWIWRSLI